MNHCARKANVLKILHVTSHMEYGSTARQLSLLASHLPPEAYHPLVCVLAGPTPWGERLRTANVEVEELGWKRPIDLRPFVSLFSRIQVFRPDIIHVWGCQALRAVTLCRGRLRPRIVVSAAVLETSPPNLIDRWLLRRVDGVLAFGQTEAQRYHALGIPPHRVLVGAPAVDPALLAITRASGGRQPPEGQPPEDCPVLLGIGPLERHKGFREAVWALDLLNNLYPDLHLVVAGEGPDRDRVDRFARSFGTWQRVSFTGPQPDLTPLLQQAVIVWVPSLRDGGVCAALEGMAFSRPVVASRCPSLSEIITEGETGYLVEPGDPVALARRTRLLLDNVHLRLRVGEQARRHVVSRFHPEQLVRRASVLYSAVSGS
jgi:glycosyltransferase involved in cell wall biosynthesis